MVNVVMVANYEETIEYRIAAIEPLSGMILSVKGCEGYRLPRIRIPKWTRHAEEINDLLHSEWQLSTLVLSIKQSLDGRPSWAIVELLGRVETETPNGLTLIGIELLTESELDPAERTSLANCRSGEMLASGPFACCGWLDEALSWIRKSLPHREVDLDGELRQFSAGGTSALLRFSTSTGYSYWLKATGKQNQREGVLTVELSKLFPEYLPKLIAYRQDWNAWLMEDAGRPLGGIQNLQLLSLAVKNLAGLQIKSLKHIGRLQAAGCMGRPLESLQHHLTEMFTFLEVAMQHQISTKAKPLEPSRLREIQAVVEVACRRMDELQIPDCIVNGDINLDNILFDGSRISFTDWAEGGIGNPFITFQQLLQHVTREGEHIDWVQPLCEVYKTSWLALLTSNQIDIALLLAPLLTIADYLHARGDWLTSGRRDDQGFQGFARTLARCMDRAANELLSRKALEGCAC